MSISLEKKLEEATIAKKRYRASFFVATAAFLIVVGVVYNQTVLEYAVLDQVTITRQSNNDNKVSFKYDVIEPGRIDFIYGQAILTDHKPVQQDDGFEWTWSAEGATTIRVRSRQWLLPHWDEQTFEF
ncbi:hypothetical protein [Thiospirillum jenense]|uniref:Uncharacterized protein n=1 Tax=Thiospirillum jenense TaxID=1653858 RepID=A0A839HCH4_9GAMM|nr:hypothetical protein [Thiospirillum jenense]MBB1126665.1 hypothetical protein [Thiospirillum jenense]